MTNERKPTDKKYKQIYDCSINHPNRYTSAYVGLDDYLHTEVWKRIKGDCLKAYGYRCNNCGTAMNLHVHHIRYPEVWGEETLDDLVVLCDKCHNDIHELDNNK